MRRFFVLFLVLVPSLFAAQEHTASPQATIDLSKVASESPTPGSTFSVEFITDDTIAICRHLQNGGCAISFVALERQGGEHVGSVVADKQQVILRSGPDHLLTTSLTDPISEMYLVKGNSKEAIPKISSYLISASGKTGGFSTDQSWIVYELVPTVRELRKGAGVLLSVSDSKLAIRNGNTIYIGTLEGGQVGSFVVKPVTRCPTEVTLLSDSLFLRTCGGGRIADWNGKELRKIRPPDGNATRIQTDESGSRLLLDCVTRHVPVTQSAAELAQTIASLGVGAPNQFSNGEAVRVLDTSTGAVCFEWSARLPRVDAFFSHASLSPSGRLLAIARAEKLSIYRLPDSCLPH